MLVGGCFSCSQDENKDNIDMSETIESVKDSEIVIDEELFGEWKLVKAILQNVSDEPVSYDYADCNIVFEFQDNGILKITGVDAMSESYYGPSDGEYVFSARRYDSHSGYRGGLIGWSTIGTTYKDYYGYHLVSSNRLEMNGRTVYFLKRNNEENQEPEAIDERISGKWKLVDKRGSVPPEDYVDYNIVFEFKTNGIVSVSSIPDHLSIYAFPFILENGDFRYSAFVLEDYAQHIVIEIAYSWGYAVFSPESELMNFPATHPLIAPFTGPPREYFYFIKIE